MDEQRITYEIGSQNGKAVNIKVAKFSLATTEMYKSKNGQTHSNTKMA